MKRSIFVFILICILFVNCACQQVMPEQSDGGDTTAANGEQTQETTDLTEQEPPTEQTTERIVETEPIMGGDVPSLIIESESDYQKFIVQCTELPEGFVRYEDVAAFGEFQKLTFSVLGNYGYYLYTLEDSAGFSMQITVNHTPKQNSDQQILTFETSASDLRVCGSDSESLEIYQKGELRYYYVSGKLLLISWMHNGIEYNVKGGFETDLSAYPQSAEATVLCGLLRIDTAANTYSDLFSDK